MKKATEQKNYKKMISFKDCFIKETTLREGLFHETETNINGNEIVISSKLDEDNDFITVYVTTIMSEVPYTQEFMIDFGQELSGLSDKESVTYVLNDTIGNNVVGLLQCNDVEFKGTDYGISSEWLHSHDNELFNISYNISDNGKSYLKFFKLRDDTSEEEIIEDEKEKLKSQINSWL